VALAETGALELVPALGIVNGIMFAVAICAVVISLRVPHQPAEPQPGRVSVPAGIPLEHP
jgi:hypothetical protein